MVLAAAVVGPDVARAEISPHDRVMEIPYGFGADEIDTTLCEFGIHWKNLISNFRVAEDGSLWLLTAGARPAVRRFESVGGRGLQRERIDLPMVPGGYDDFLIVGGEVFLSQSLTDVTDHALFYRVAGDLIAQRIVLARKIGFNRLRGWGFVNLGRLRKTGADIYNCFPRTSSCIRIGAEARLFPRLETIDLVPGIPVLAGELVWADRSFVFRGIAPVLDMSAGPPAQLEEVFDDGGFAIRRTEADPAVRPVEERFEIYDAAGGLRREIRTRAPDRERFSVRDGEVDYVTPQAIYQLEFGRKGVLLIRY
jgi:hypothetical protein